MFDLGMSELLLIGIVALIVVGPKDLPGLFRSVGQFVGRAKGMAREFSRAMDEAADEAGVKDVSKTLRDAANPGKMGLDKVKEATDSFKNWTPGSETAKLAEHRAAAAKKIHDSTAKKAMERQAAESAAAKMADVTPKKPAAKPGTPAKTADKASAKVTAKATAKAPAKASAKAPAKTSVAKKPAAKSTAKDKA